MQVHILMYMNQYQSIAIVFFLIYMHTSIKTTSVGVFKIQVTVTSIRHINFRYHGDTIHVYLTDMFYFFDNQP